MNIVTENTERDRTVESIVRVLEEKCAGTIGEKMTGLMKEISEFKIEGDVEKILDKFEKMMVESKKIDLAQNLEYAILLQFIDILEKSGKISSEERYRLKDGNPKVEDGEERIRKELKRMKVVISRENVLKDGVIETHYIAREWESRYGRWRNYMERNGYKRSDSRKGYWRNGAAQSLQRYVKDRQGSRFRSQSGLKDRL